MRPVKPLPTKKVYVRVVRDGVLTWRRVIAEGILPNRLGQRVRTVTYSNDGDRGAHTITRRSFLRWARKAYTAAFP